MVTRRPPDARPEPLKLVTTSVVRGSHQGESHGGVYLIDLEAREVRQTIDWNTAGHRLAGPRLGPRPARHRLRRRDGLHRGERRALRVHAAISVRSAPGAIPTSSTATRSRSGSGRLFLTSTGFDSILGFDLDRKEFSWAMHVDDAPVPVPRRGSSIRAQGRRTADAQQAAPQQRALHEGRHVHRRACEPAACCCSTGARSRCRSSCRRARTMRARSATACCSTTPRRTPCAMPGAARAARIAPCASRVTIPPSAPEPRPGPEPHRPPGLRARALRALGHAWSPAVPRRRRFRSTTSRRNERLLVGQPDDGRPQRHPRPRGLALRLMSPALRTLSGSSAMMSRELLLPRAEVLLVVPPGAERTRVDRLPHLFRARRLHRRAPSRGNAGRLPRTAARSARGCDAPAPRGRRLSPRSARPAPCRAARGASAASSRGTCR